MTADRSADADWLQACTTAMIGHGTAFGLPWPRTNFTDVEWTRLYESALRDHLIGAIVEAVADGSIELSDSQLDELRQQHERQQAHALLLERLLLDVVRVLSAAGIHTRVLKGPALAHLVYGDPAWRSFGDIDVLVPAARFQDAVNEVVAEMGGSLAMPELRPGFDREFGKEALLRIGRFEVDLHRTLAPGGFGLVIDLDDLFSSRGTVQIGGREVSTLGPSHMLMHACYNAALGDAEPRGAALRDLALCAERLPVGPEQVRRASQAWRSAAVVRRAATLLGAHIGHPTKLSELQDVAVTRREAWLLRSYRSPATPYTRSLGSLLVISGFAARARYLRAIVRPSEEYLRSRGWSERSHVRRALGQLGRRR